VQRPTGSICTTAQALMMLAEAKANLGQSAQSMDYLAQASQIIEATDERYGESEMHRLRGDVLNATGDQAAAEESYQQALAVARQQSAKTSELHAAASLARLWRDQGRRTEARDLLAPVYNWFTEGPDTPVLKDAKALVEQLSA
jgi:predicted ATPase